MDHEAIFGTGNLGHQLPDLTIGDSLLAHPALPALLGKNFDRDPQLRSHAVADVYLWVGECEQRTDEILAQLPVDWNIEETNLRQGLQDKLFDKQRVAEVLENFSDLLAQL